MDPEQVPNRSIIVIGGSAGSTAPLKALLAALPGDLAAAVFIALHVPARSAGIFAIVASSVSSLPVHQAEDGMAIEPGNIYLAVPDRHLIVTPGRMRLGRGPRENMVRPAIDALFRSAAAAYGPQVIGVVLSGMLNDGAAGLEAIKRCGGVALVQDPDEALADEMPRSALRATEVDFTLPSARLGDVLSDLVREPAGWPRPVPPDIQLEVNIAAGERVDSEVMQCLADPAALTCPQCGGVMSEMRESKTLRYRCQVGHAFTADALAKEQEATVDEALRTALRIIEERAELVSRMAQDARGAGRPAIADTYEERALEYRRYAESIRRAVLRSMGSPAPGGPLTSGGTA